MKESNDIERSGDKKDLAVLLAQSKNARDKIENDPEFRAAVARSERGTAALKRMGYRVERSAPATPDVTVEKRTDEAATPVAADPTLQPLPADPVVVPGITNIRERSSYGPDSRYSLIGDKVRLKMLQRNQNAVIDAGGRPHGAGEDIPAPGQGDINDVYRRLAVHDALYRNRTTASGEGAGFVPKAWVGDLFATAARQVSKMPELLTREPLPAKGQKVYVPYIGTGVTTAAVNEAPTLVPSDITSDQVEASVVTIVGSVVASRQVADRSGGLFDIAASQDAARDLAREVDYQVLQGNGSAPNMLGLLNVTGKTTTTYTDASPTVAEFRSKAWKAYEDITAASGLEPDTMIVHPRRMAWAMQGTDTASRQTLAVDFPARPVAVGSLPTAIGSGTDEDVALLFARDAVVLMMSEPVFDVMLDNSLSNTMEFRLVARVYAAMAVRRPEAVGLITGTGMAAPTL